MAIGRLLSARRQFLAFEAVRTAGFLVDAGIVQGLTNSGINAIAAQLVAFAVAVCVTWLGNPAPGPLASGPVAAPWPESGFCMSRPIPSGGLSITGSISRWS